MLTETSAAVSLVKYSLPACLAFHEVTIVLMSSEIMSMQHMCTGSGCATHRTCVRTSQCFAWPCVLLLAGQLVLWPQHPAFCRTLTGADTFPVWLSCIHVKDLYTQMTNAAHSCCSWHLHTVATEHQVSVCADVSARPQCNCHVAGPWQKAIVHSALHCLLPCQTAWKQQLTK